MARKDPPTLLGSHFDKLKETLEKRKKYIKNEYQAYGLELAQELNDWKNRSIYIRLARTVDRSILEAARYFVKDQTRGTIKSPCRLFMWKLKELRSPKEVKPDAQLPLTKE